MKLFRSIIFWCHLSIGITAMIVIVVMSATGVLLTYQKQITNWADRRAVDAGPPAANTPRLSPDAIIQRAAQSAGKAPTALTIRSRADAPAEVTFGPDRQLVNAYTGATLGQGSAGARTFFRVVTAWHRTLGATGTNRA